MSWSNPSDCRLTSGYLATQTELARELFCSSDGASTDQSFAFTQGLAYLIATAADVSPELYAVVGHQRGGEILTGGVRDAMRLPENIVGITQEVKGTMVWAADEEIYASSILVSGVQVDEIAGFVEGL